MLKVEELEKQLNQGCAEGIYLLYGEDTFLLEQQLNKIKKNFGEMIKGINYIYIDENSVQELIADIETPVLFNVNFGHSVPRCIIPYDAEATIDYDNRRIFINNPILEKNNENTRKL